MFDHQSDNHLLLAVIKQINGISKDMLSIRCTVLMENGIGLSFLTRSAIFTAIRRLYSGFETIRRSTLHRSIVASRKKINASFLFQLLHLFIVRYNMQPWNHWCNKQFGQQHLIYYPHCNLLKWFVKII